METQAKFDFQPRKPHGQNALHLNACLLYESLDACVLDQSGKGLSDSRARKVCTGLMKSVAMNSSNPFDGFSLNTGSWWEDNDFLYVPVTATSEGVHNAAYKSYKELQKGFPHFENTPLCVLHPPGRGIMGTDEIHGWVRDTKLDPKNAAWKGTAYFIKHPDTLREMGHTEESVKAHLALLDAIRAGAKFDGSIGYYHDTIYEEGIFQGVRFDRREINIYSDHLAIVDRGASDWQMGTGFGQNKDDVEGNAYASKSPYKGRFESHHLKRPPTTWSGSTSEDHDHKHLVWATYGFDSTGEERIQVYITPVGGVTDDLHDHEWVQGEKTTGGGGHKHAMPKEFTDWLKQWHEYHVENKELPKGLDGYPFRGVTKSRIYDFLFQRGQKKVSGNHRKDPILASLLKAPGKFYTQETFSMDAKQALVVKALSLNQLAEMNPEVAKTLSENKQLKSRLSVREEAYRKSIAANKKMESDLQANTERLNRYEANHKKKVDLTRNHLVRDICSVTGQKPEAYKDIGLNAIKATHDAVVKAAEFGANAAKGSKNMEFGKKEAEHEEEEFEEGLGKNMDDDDMDYNGEDDDEDYSETEELEVELQDAGGSKQDIERPDQGDPYKMQDKPTENRRQADRTVLASRIRQGLLAPTANAKKQAAKKQVSKNKEQSSVYERIALNHQTPKGGEN